MPAVDTREKALAKFLEAKALLDTDGNLPAEQAEAFDALMTEAKEIDKQYAVEAAREGSVETLRERLEYYSGKASGTPMRFNTTVLDPTLPKSLGEQFIASQAYKTLKGSGALDSPESHFRSDRVTFTVPQSIQAAADDVIHTEPGGPAAIVQPFRLPGILPLAQRPLTIRALFPQETMTAGDTIEYAQQTGFTPASSPLTVKQSTADDDAAGLKKQSSLAWDLNTARAEWIATYMVATRQALADENQIRSLIDNQGRLMIQLEEEDQLLNGNGTPPNISGILDQGALQTLDLTGEDNLDGIRTARRLVQTGLSRLRPDFIVVHPIDSEEFDLLKDENGLYRGGNPIGNFNFDNSIWRLRRVESEAIDEGHALVGSGAGGTVWERQPISVLTADQHADFFVRNLIVILFEERLAFPIYFPTAFVDVTLADWAAGS